MTTTAPAGAPEQTDDALVEAARSNALYVDRQYRSGEHEPLRSLRFRPLRELRDAQHAAARLRDDARAAEQTARDAADEPAADLAASDVRRFAAVVDILEDACRLSSLALVGGTEPSAPPAGWTVPPYPPQDELVSPLLDELAGALHRVVPPSASRGGWRWQIDVLADPVTRAVAARWKLVPDHPDVQVTDLPVPTAGQPRLEAAPEPE